MSAPSKDIIRGYVREVQNVDLSDASIDRLVSACDTAVTAIETLASDSLFDTEPDNLHRVLDELAEDED